MKLERDKACFGFDERDIHNIIISRVIMSTEVDIKSPEHTLVQALTLFLARNLAFFGDLALSEIIPSA